MSDDVSRRAGELGGSVMWHGRIERHTTVLCADIVLVGQGTKGSAPPTQVGCSDSQQSRKGSNTLQRRLLDASLVVVGWVGASLPIGRPSRLNSNSPVFMQCNHLRPVRKYKRQYPHHTPQPRSGEMGATPWISKLGFLRELRIAHTTIAKEWVGQAMVRF